MVVAGTSWLIAADGGPAAQQQEVVLGPNYGTAFQRMALRLLGRGSGCLDESGYRGTSEVSRCIPFQ